MEAFKPKKSIFVHCCANCEFGKKLNIMGTALDYICGKDLDNPRHLTGRHKCDVKVENTDNQISWFDEMKED